MNQDQLLESLLTLPLADADILAHYHGVAATTVRRALAPFLAQGWVGTITPALVGGTVSQLYYVTPQFFIAGGDEPESLQRLALTTQHDIPHLLKTLPRLPHILTLYDVIAEVGRQACQQQTDIPYWAPWHKTVLPKPVVLAWSRDQVIADTDDRGYPWRVRLHADITVGIAYTWFQRQVERIERHQVSVLVDDEQMPEREMRNAVRNFARYYRRRSPSSALCIVTASYARYAFWQHLVRQVDDRPKGVIILTNRQHGWPYVLGGTVTPPNWIERAIGLQRGATEIDGMPWLLRGVPGDVVADQGPSPAEIAAQPLTPMQRQFYAPAMAAWDLSMWIKHLLRKPAPPAYVLRAATSLMLSHRQHQLLTVVATSPQISIEDICLLVNLTPEAVLILVQELGKWGLVLQRTIVGKTPIPAWDEHLHLTQMQRTAHVVEATIAGLRYLGGVYPRLDTWIRDRKNQSLHDAGTIRLLVALRRRLEEVCPNTAMRWQVGPSGELRYRDAREGVTHRIFPDGHGVVSQRFLNGRDHVARILVESDMGNERMPIITEKIANYAAWDASNQWREEVTAWGYYTPLLANLLIIVPTVAQEGRFVQAIWNTTFRRTRIYITTHERLITMPLEAAWQCLTSPEHDDEGFLGCVYNDVTSEESGGD